MDGTINEIRNLNEENAGLITTQIIRQTAPSIDRKTSLHTAAIHKQKDTPKTRSSLESSVIKSIVELSSPRLPLSISRRKVDSVSSVGE